MRLPVTTAIVLVGVAFSGSLCAQVANRVDFPTEASSYRPSDLEGGPEDWLDFTTDDATEAARFAMALGDRAGTSDSELARQLRAKARQVAQHALNLGAEAPLLQLMLVTSDEQGNRLMERLDPDEKIDALLQRGEKAFGLQDFGAALRAYGAVLALNPDHYRATLFMGDVYFSRHEYEHAAKFFARAVALDPDAAVAHRYWGDALMREERLDEAREHYIDALVASPYDSFCRQSMVNWAKAAGVPLRSSDAWFPSSTIVWEPESEGPQIVLNPNDQGDVLSLVFATGRLHWLTVEQELSSPTASKPYRQSLAETSAALRMVIRSAVELAGADNHEEMPNEAFIADVSQLAHLDEAGLLEAYILLDRANADLAQDYPAYRSDHRATVRRYIIEVWLRSEDRTPSY